MTVPPDQDPGDPVDRVSVDSTSNEPVRLDKDFLQKNIDRSVDYRKEYYKYNIGIATALLAFTVSFPSTLSTIEYPWLIFAAWIGLGAAVLSGVGSHFLWSLFFITWRNFDNRGHREEGQVERGPITALRRLLDGLQIVGLIVGVGGVVAFAGLNLGNIALKEKTAPPVPPIAGKTAPSGTSAPSGTTTPTTPPASNGGRAQ